MSRQPVTTTSCYSRLDREGQRKAETTGLGAAKLPITAKSGHGAIFNAEGGVFIVPAGGSEGVAPGHPSQRH